MRHSKPKKLCECDTCECDSADALSHQLRATEHSEISVTGTQAAAACSDTAVEAGSPKRTIMSLALH